MHPERYAFTRRKKLVESKLAKITEGTCVMYDKTPRVELCMVNQIRLFMLPPQRSAGSAVCMTVGSAQPGWSMQSWSKPR